MFRWLFYEEQFLRDLLRAHLGFGKFMPWPKPYTHAMIGQKRNETNDQMMEERDKSGLKLGNGNLFTNRLIATI